MIIAKEKYYPYTLSPAERAGLVYARIDIDHEEHLVALKNCDRHQVIPIIEKRTFPHPSYVTSETFKDLQNHYCLFSKQLVAEGFNRLVISVDNDGALQKIMSPRFNAFEITERIDFLCSLYRSLKGITDTIDVLLTVEELAPSGMDATDGIKIAKALEACGLKEIIATGGTRDFSPLLRRRATQRKSFEESEFLSNEPSLASALWLKKHTHLSVQCLAPLDDHNAACALAATMGLLGLIEKSQDLDI